VLDAIESIHVPIGLLGSLVPLGILCVWVVRARRGLHLKPSADASVTDRRHLGLALGLIYPLRLARLPEWRRGRSTREPRAAAVAGLLADEHGC
jgi:hypothetical protein